ncbi:deoxyribose-phosphate aldolase [Methylobacterium sp. J-090]|uniref:deoxyribose-phosphate aldolase n=1 Tax=Methylobacterium sp. J-090 TaxID=2836666 RepID=UPI001FBB9F75|nr:deoxyribose-phosphate aldolase [Methylobacterium sp. J-090]MCJ2083114.1 deoxyribose-phosphate aldolase [Methylobacterium sp. J-090]
MTDSPTAQRALPLLDLTDLSDTGTGAAIEALCLTARASGVAAVCVWPRFVAQSTGLLAGSGVRVATVVNFPAGGNDAEEAVRETRDALRDGADEIDLVLPYDALREGRVEPAHAMVAEVREACGTACLKVILETGILQSPPLIAQASRLALAAGADMIKTSTGKTAVSATPEAVEIMLDAIRDAGGTHGLKISGGIRTVADAALYLALADRIMGPDWATPKTFRIGASSLHAALLAALEPAA